VHDTLFNSLRLCAEVVSVELGAEGERLFFSVNKGDKLKLGKITGSVIGTLVAQNGFLADLAPFRGSNRLSPHDLMRTMHMTTMSQ
jgi:hypothetical protein